MLGAVSPESFDTLHSYSNTFQMPFITPWFPEKVSSYLNNIKESKRNKRNKKEKICKPHRGKKIEVIRMTRQKKKNIKQINRNHTKRWANTNNRQKKHE